MTSLNINFSRSEFSLLSEQCAAIANKTSDCEALVFGDPLSGTSITFSVVEDDSPEILAEQEYLSKSELERAEAISKELGLLNGGEDEQ